MTTCRVCTWWDRPKARNATVHEVVIREGLEVLVAPHWAERTIAGWLVGPAQAATAFGNENPHPDSDSDSDMIRREGGPA